MWFFPSGLSGEPDAQQRRAVAAKKLTPEQIAKATEAAHACQARRYKGG